MLNLTVVIKWELWVAPVPVDWKWKNALIFAIEQEADDV